MVPIYPMYVQTFWHVYFSIIEDYLNFFEKFPGVTGSPICNFCA